MNKFVIQNIAAHARLAKTRELLTKMELGAGKTAVCFAVDSRLAEAVFNVCAFRAIPPDVLLSALLSVPLADLMGSPEHLKKVLEHLEEIGAKVEKPERDLRAEVLAYSASATARL